MSPQIDKKNHVDASKSSQHVSLLLLLLLLLRLRGNNCPKIITASTRGVHLTAKLVCGDLHLNRRDLVLPKAPQVQNLPNLFLEHIARQSSQHISTSQKANSSCTVASPKPPQLVVQQEEEEELRTLELGAGMLVVVLRMVRMTHTQVQLGAQIEVHRKGKGCKD